MWNQIRSPQVNQILLAEMPSRRALQSLPKFSHGAVKFQTVQVWRNHFFEGIADLTTFYASFFGREILLRSKDYDDSLSFDSWTPHDLEIIWLDPTRYAENMSQVEFVNWLLGRVESLRSQSESPILVLSWGLDEEAAQLMTLGIMQVPGAVYTDVSKGHSANPSGFLDLRLLSISGSQISARSQVLIARRLALNWIPAMLEPPIKAIVLDLDNTLYRGVLGEETARGISYLDGHRGLHRALKTLGEDGIFLAIASKNLDDDVIDLWSSRRDFDLRLEDFAARAISWQKKSEGIRQICEELRIGQDAVLFVDDNPGELLEVAKELPEVNLILADENPSITERSVQFFPGVFQWRSSLSAKFRSHDLRANLARESIRASTSQEFDYFRELGAEINLFLDEPSHLVRGAELTRKTNQFNLSLARSSEAHISSAIVDPDRAFVSISLRDRLSDSGIVGVIVARQEASTLVVEEVCISCRALGRGLEESMIIEGLKLIANPSTIDEVRFMISEGNRNLPARELIRSLAESEPRENVIHMPIGKVRSYSLKAGVKFFWGIK